MEENKSGLSISMKESDRAHEFLERLCSYSYTTEIWFTLYMSGGAYRYSELLRFVGCSPSTLSRSLLRLGDDGLVRTVNGKYQAVSPPWLQKLQNLEEFLVHAKSLLDSL